MISTKRICCSLVMAGLILCYGARANENTMEVEERGISGSMVNESNESGFFNNEGSHPFLRSLDVSSNITDSKNKKFNGHVHGLIPLSYDSAESQAFFFAPGVTYYNSHMIYNAGLGFRQLNKSGDFFWGVNVFYDNDSRVKNERFSQGVELGVPFVTLSGNVYQSAGQWRKIKEGPWQEKAAGGYDAKLKLELPFYPQVSLSTRYFVWNGKNVDLYRKNKFQDSPRGFVHGIEYRPVSLVGIAFQRTLERRQQQNNTAVAINLRYDFGRSFDSQTAFNWHQGPSSLKNKLFDGVDREHVVISKKRLAPVIPMTNINPPADDEDDEDLSGDDHSVTTNEDTRSEISDRESRLGDDDDEDVSSRDGSLRFYTPPLITPQHSNDGSLRSYDSENESEDISSTTDVVLRTNGIPQAISKSQCPFARFFDPSDEVKTGGEKMSCSLKSHNYQHMVTADQTAWMLKGINHRALKEDGSVKFPNRLKNPFKHESGGYKQKPENKSFVNMTERILKSIKETES